MTPPRRRKDTHLPPCLYLKHGAYYYVKANRWTHLGHTLATALKRYGEIIATPSTGGLDPLLSETLERAAERVKPATIAQYRAAARKIAAAFAEFTPSQVKAHHIAQYLDHLRHTPNMANRCRTLLKLAFDRAVLMGECEHNPVASIPRHRERRRSRYLSDAEYLAIWRASPPVLQVIMDLSYLTGGQRIGDILKIRLSDISEAGILIQPEKTTDRGGDGKALLIASTAELDDTIRRARALHGTGITPLYLFGLRHGATFHIRSYRGVRDIWDRATANAGIEDAHLHDLRAKALTDAKRQGLDPKALALHSSDAMTARYLRGREIPVTQGPSLRRLIDAREKQASKP